MIRLAALLAGILMAAAVGIAYADGVGEANYDYVSPPAYLKSSNTAPAGAAGTVAFKNGVSEVGNVTTADTQAGINFGPGVFPPQPGQTGVHVVITPLARFPHLPGHDLLNGNVYGFRATYVPSDRPVGTLSGPALVTLVYPRTPIGTLALKNGKWTDLCRWKTVIRTASTISCYERSIAPEAALLRGSHTAPPGLDSYIILALSVVVAVSTVGVISYVVYTNFIRPRPPSRPRPRPSGRAR